MLNLLNAGLAILLILGASGAVAWFIFSRIARSQGLTMGQVVQNTIRRDLDTARLTSRRVNFAYRALMRDTGVSGPAGQVIPVGTIEVRMPHDDFQFIRHLGLREFVAQLAAYRQEYAEKQGWATANDAPALVSAFLDPTLKRLRPSFINYFRDRPGSTRVWSDDSGITRTEDRTQTHLNPVESEMPSTATVSYGDIRWTLTPEGAPYRLGRASDNEIRIDHPHVSAHHAVISFDGPAWVFTVRSAKNSTRLAGELATGPFQLSPGASITVGSSDAIEFSMNDSRSTDKTEEL